MKCPNCGQETIFTEHHATIRGSLGLSYDEDWGMDYYEQEWLTCDACGAATDDSELRRCNPEVKVI